MSSPAVVAQGDITVRQLVDDFFLGGRHSQYPIVVEEGVVGLLRMSDVKEVPADSWDTTRLVDIARHDVAGLVVHPDASLESVLGRLGPEGPGALLVVEEDRLVGIVTRADLIRALRRTSAIG
jgi:CBS domain-containing protein